MPLSWIAGSLHTLESNWSYFEHIITVNSDKTLSSINFELNVSSGADGNYYFDFLQLLLGVTVQEEGITYVTIDDETSQLPYSVQHENITSVNMHKTYPKRYAQAGMPTPASGELIVWCDIDDGNRIYLVFNDPTSGTKKVEMT